MRAAASVCVVVVLLVGANVSAKADGVELWQLHAYIYVSDGGPSTYAANNTLTPPWSQTTPLSVGGTSGVSEVEGVASGMTGRGEMYTSAALDHSVRPGTETFVTGVGSSTYALSGEATFSGGLGGLSYEVLLWDVTADIIVFRNIQASEDVPSEAFTLGQEGGNSTNLLVGSPTGTLIDGHFYYFGAVAHLTNGLHSSALTGAWWATMSVNVVNIIPEPTTFALFGLGTGGLFLAIRRRRTRT